MCLRRWPMWRWGFCSPTHRFRQSECFVPVAFVELSVVGRHGVERCVRCGTRPPRTASSGRCRRVAFRCREPRRLGWSLVFWGIAAGWAAAIFARVRDLPGIVAICLAAAIVFYDRMESGPMAGPLRWAHAGVQCPFGNECIAVTVVARQRPEWSPAESECTSSASLVCAT